MYLCLFHPVGGSKQSASFIDFFLPDEESEFTGAYQKDNYGLIIELNEKMR